MKTFSAKPSDIERKWFVVDAEGLIAAAAAAIGAPIDCLINNASICAKQPLDYEPIYNVTKAALMMFSKNLAEEVIGDNIRVNTIAPVAASRLTEDILPPDFLDKLKPELVAPLVVYLCSDRCSETGAVFNTGMGYVNRAAVMTGPGAVIGNAEQPPTPEQIHQHWDQINATVGAGEHPDLTSALMDLMSPPSPVTIEAGTTGAGKGMDQTVAAIFELSRARRAGMLPS